MVFIKDIAIPLIVAALAIGLINYIILLVLRFIRLDFGLLRFLLFLLVWYFVGPILYQLLLNNLIIYENEVIEFIYTPIQTIMRLFEI